MKEDDAVDVASQDVATLLVSLAGQLRRSPGGPDPHQTASSGPLSDRRFQWWVFSAPRSAGPAVPIREILARCPGRS